MSHRQQKSGRREKLSSSDRVLSERLSEIKGRIECFLDEDDVKKVLDVVSERPLWLGANGDRIAKLLKLKYRFNENLAFDASLVIEQTAPVRKDQSSEEEEEEDSGEGVTCFEGGLSKHEARFFPASHSKQNVASGMVLDGNDYKCVSDLELPKCFKMKSKVLRSSQEDCRSDKEQQKRSAKEETWKASGKTKGVEEGCSDKEQSKGSAKEGSRNTPAKAKGGDEEGKVKGGEEEGCYDEEQPKGSPKEACWKNPAKVKGGEEEDISDVEQLKKLAKEAPGKTPANVKAGEEEGCSNEEQPKRPAKEATRKTLAKGEEEDTRGEGESYGQPWQKKIKFQMSANIAHKKKEEKYAASVAVNIFNEGDDADKTSVNENREQNKQPFASTTSPLSDNVANRTVFVKNLAQDVDENSLKVYFQTAGDVKEVQLARQSNGTLIGFGHVEFYTEEAAKKDNWFMLRLVGNLGDISMDEKFMLEKQDIRFGHPKRYSDSFGRSQKKRSFSTWKKNTGSYLNSHSSRF